jgi:hypothetical protein
VEGEEERGPTVASSISLLTFERKSYSRRRCPFLIIEGLFILAREAIKGTEARVIGLSYRSDSHGG